MIRSTRLTSFVLGEKVTLKDLREIVEKTAGMPDESRVEPRVINGQRDSQSYTFIIEENI